MPETVSDTELAKLAAQGDRLALERLLVRHQPALLRLIRAEMGPALLACTTPEDLFQKCCLEAVKSIHGFEIQGDESVFRWLAAIARHRVLDTAKAASMREMTVAAKGRRHDFESTDDLFHALSAGISTASHKLRRQELEDAVTAAVAALEHPLQRQAVTLRYLEGHSLDETARAMGLTADAVRGHLHRAKDRLASALGPLCDLISNS
jgi:RNA polymerase sigma-70 factor (ECF subfamily)